MRHKIFGFLYDTCEVIASIMLVMIPVGVGAGVALTILKDADYISADWFWVAFPYWICPAIGFAAAVGMLLFSFLSDLYEGE